jgi:uncharacterized OB-fold protein
MRLPMVEPLVTPETEPYFSAAAQGRLVLPRCRDCGWLIWYPRQFCNECGSLDVEWVPVSGHGRVYTFSVVRRGQGPYRDAVPYVLAYVDLDEGPRVLTNIVDVDPANLQIGDPVVALLQPTGNGAAMLRFQPSPESQPSPQPEERS